jgi:hypothetical protein
MNGKRSSGLIPRSRAKRGVSKDGEVVTFMVR